jgi:phosphopantetheinyl transferase (holo-ACP synthase)
MIGNDIVDLKLASSSPNCRRKRFIDKVFSVEEQKIISHSSDPFLTIWLLWSMKESAYKIYARQHSEQFFAPKKIKCKLSSYTEGIVEIFSETYKTITTIDKDYIYTIAHKDFSEVIVSNCFKVDMTTYSVQHYTSYLSIINTIAELKNIPTVSLVIKKNEIGVPNLYRNNVVQSILFSITHHGNYGAYAILK